MMPTLSVIAESIPVEEFRLFLKNKALKPMDNYDGHFANTKDTLWIKLLNTELESIRKDSPAVWETICLFFPSEPQTNIIIDVGRTDESKQLAIELVQAMGERWKIILLDDYFNVYSDQDIKTLRSTDLEW